MKFSRNISMKFDCINGTLWEGHLHYCYFFWITHSRMLSSILAIQIITILRVIRTKTGESVLHKPIIKKKEHVTPIHAWVVRWGKPAMKYFHAFSSSRLRARKWSKENKICDVGHSVHCKRNFLKLSIKRQGIYLLSYKLLPPQAIASPTCFC